MYDLRGTPHNLGDLHTVRMVYDWEIPHLEDPVGSGAGEVQHGHLRILRASEIQTRTVYNYIPPKSPKKCILYIYIMKAKT